MTQTTLLEFPEPSVVNITLVGIPPAVLGEKIARTSEGSLGFDRHSVTYDVIAETRDGRLLYISMTKIRHRDGVSATIIVSRIRETDEPLEYLQDSTLAELLDDISRYPNPWNEVVRG